MVLIRLARQPPELAQAIQARTIQKRAIQLQVIQIHAQAESQALERALVLKLLARQEQQGSARLRRYRRWFGRRRRSGWECDSPESRRGLEKLDLDVTLRAGICF